MKAKSLKNKGETCRDLLIENQSLASPEEIEIGYQVEWMGRKAGDMSRDELLCLVAQLDTLIARLAPMTPRGVVSREACRPTVRPHTASWEDPQV